MGAPVMDKSYNGHTESPALYALGDPVCMEPTPMLERGLSTARQKS